MPRASVAPVFVGGNAPGSTAAILARGSVMVDPGLADKTALVFFVPFTLVNTKNNLTGHWSSKAAYTRKLRQAAHLFCHVAALETKWTAAPATPKEIRLVATVRRLMDSVDGLRQAIAPALDGLGPCAHSRGGPGCNHAYMIEEDADRAGHRISYGQEIGRYLGVRVTVVV